MDIHTIRMELRTKSIYDLPLRVTYYARVSSESDEQLNSLGNQVSYYEDLIRRNLPWTCLLYTSPSPRDRQKSRMPSSA